LKDLAAGRARARLSGLLIGLELAGAKPYWSGQALGLIGAPQLCERYKSALDRAAVPSTIYVAEHLTLDGLKSAYHALNGAQE
jgi:2-dehydro-3-deoxygalactonokinase